MTTYSKIATAAITGLSLLAAGCSSTAAVESIDATTSAPTTATIAAPSTTTADSTTTTAAPHEPIQFTGANTFTFGSLGGLRLTLPDGVNSFAEADLVALRTDEAPGTEVVITRIFEVGITQNPTTEQVTEWLSESFEVEIAQQGDPIDFAGTTLERFEVRPLQDLGNPGLFSSLPNQYQSDYLWSPLPNADLYLAPVDGGVLAVAAVGDSLEAVANGADLITAVISSAELVGGDNEMYVPQLGDRGQEIFGTASEMVQPEPKEDGPPLLAAQFAPIEPGLYQSIHVDPRLELEIPEGWHTSPNEPARVTLTDGLARGPGDFVINMISGPRSVTGQGFALGYGSKAVDATDISAFLALDGDRHPNFQVQNIDPDATIGGLPAVRFDARVNPEATCQVEDPCQFLITGSGGFSNSEILPGNRYRIWWIERTDGPAIVISAGAPAASAQAWIEGPAADLLDSFRFFPEE